MSLTPADVLALIVVMAGSPSNRDAVEAPDEKLSDRGPCYAAVSFSKTPPTDAKAARFTKRLSRDRGTLQLRYGWERYRCTFIDAEWGAGEQRHAGGRVA